MEPKPPFGEYVGLNKGYEVFSNSSCFARLRIITKTGWEKKLKKD